METWLRRAAGTTITAACLVATVGAAQPKDEFLRSQQSNRSALLSYTWKSRTELKVDDETRSILLEQVRYDIDGKLQRTPIGGSKEESQIAPALHPLGGVIRHRVAAKKKEQLRELVQELAALAGSYVQIPPDRMQMFAAQAAFSKGNGSDIRIHGRNVNQMGDGMTVWIDPTNQVMRRVEIDATLDAKPVAIVVDHRTLDNGLTYPARQVLRYPNKEIELIVETYEYQFVGASR